MRLSSTPISLSILICNQILLPVYGDDDFKCQNGGFLMTGRKSYIGVFPTDMVQTLPFFDTDSHDGRYCKCGDGDIDADAGHTGVDCAVTYEICEDDSICFHGAPCVQNSETEDKYHCACPLTTDRVKEYEGKSCEYEVTSYCDLSESYPTNSDTFPGDTGKYTRKSFDFSINGEWYCTNGADCQTGVMRPSEKCDCADNFYGLHCELRNKPLCELFCFNDGICKNGVKDYTNLSDSLQEHFEPDAEYDTHCLCPTGITGRQCENDITTCGTGHCLNGGVCSSGDICDCTDAIQENPKDGEILAFAGTSCESQVTSFCEVPSGYDPMSHYCTNGGKCPEDYAENFSACECDRDHLGPRCEFTVQNAQVCDLQCDNGGTCFFGETSEESDKIGVHNKDDQMHCKCPGGHIGDGCAIDICGFNEHYCLNTGNCIEDNDSYTCECAQNDKSGIYAGANCEYVASALCGTGSIKNGTLSFCTNEGTCKPIVGESGEHPGCECNDEYTGLYCEMLKDGEDSESTDPNLWIYKLLSIFFVSFFLMSIIFYFVRRCALSNMLSRKNSTREHTPIDNHTEVDDPENSDNNITNMEEIHVEDNNITNMEEIHVEDYNPYDDDGEIVLNVQIT